MENVRRRSSAAVFGLKWIAYRLTGSVGLYSSTYRKLRLDVSWVKARLEGLGLEVTTPGTSAAWVDVVARRPRSAKE